MSAPSPTIAYEPCEKFARQFDEQDPLRRWRDHFHLPRGDDGAPLIYFCGNSLGLQPKGARGIIEQELADWSHLAVEAHFQGASPWYAYHEVFRETGARLVGARPGEVVMMNSLTVNLHLMMVSFFRPTADCFRILLDEPVFPSDMYAVKTHLQSRGLDPEDALLTVKPRPGEAVINLEDFEDTLATHGDGIDLILFSGVNFLTGQVHDLSRIVDLGHRHGCRVGLDLAHAAGNVELRLHDWEVDFACWCSYKYLNAGPGAIGGCFVHERHGADADLPRYAGWWGNDPDTRFKMHLQPAFVPRAGADGWQLSNPPILAMAPLRASLAIFDAVGMPEARAKSRRLTGYLRYLIERQPPESMQILTPADPDAQGCQLSILVHDHPRERFQRLQNAGVVCDFREPNVIRVAPVPLYNTYHEVWRFAAALGQRT